MNKREKELMRIVAEFAIVDEKDISREEILSGLGIDSLNTVELIITIEDRLNIKIDNTDLLPNKLTTVNDLINLVNKYNEE